MFVLVFTCPVKQIHCGEDLKDFLFSKISKWHWRNLNWLCCKAAFMWGFVNMLIGASEEPNILPNPGEQTSRTLKITGICVSALVSLLLVLLTIFLVKKRWGTAPHTPEINLKQGDCIQLNSTTARRPTPAPGAVLLFSVGPVFLATPPSFIHP